MKNDDISIPTIVVTILGTISLIFLISLVLALPVMWLWNSTLPELFGFKEITWWTSWKLCMLVSFVTPFRFRKFSLT